MHLELEAFLIREKKVQYSFNIITQQFMWQICAPQAKGPQNTLKILNHFDPVSN